MSKSSNNELIPYFLPIFRYLNHISTININWDIHDEKLKK